VPDTQPIEKTSIEDKKNEKQQKHESEKRQGGKYVCLVDVQMAVSKLCMWRKASTLISAHYADNPVCPTCDAITMHEISIQIRKLGLSVSLRFPRLGTVGSLYIQHQQRQQILVSSQGADLILSGVPNRNQLYRFSRCPRSLVSWTTAMLYVLAAILCPRSIN
jgi:hypothetical protein